MPNISITEPNGQEPLPICRLYREFLTSRYKIEAVLALKYLTDERVIGLPEPEEDHKASEHIRSCPKCKEWIHHVVPKDVFRRQNRMLKYCCAGMFVAFEEYKERGENRVTFELFRGEDPCWMMDGKSTFMSYCPWCGKRLPEKPFIKEGA